MNNSEFVDEFVADESARAGLEFVAQHPTGVHEGAFNVWIIHVDADKGSLRYEHDFYEHEGTMPLAEFVSALEERA